MLLIGNTGFEGELTQLEKKFPNLIEFDSQNGNSGGVLVALDTED
ncbi:MAG: hypothetical protein ABI263_04025 [Gelidibacter sp.]